MPGMDGFETAALIRQRKRSAHTPIIFLTAFADEVRVAEGYAHGAVDYISTPVVPEILRAKVRVFVELFRMTRAGQAAGGGADRSGGGTTKRAAAEEANRRLSFLAGPARSSASRSTSMSPPATSLRLAVPLLADHAVIARPDPQSGGVAS